MIRRQETSADAGAEVRVSGLRKTFGPVVAVTDVDLAVAAGEFVALLGPSGSGKTTILNAIAGFETPDTGAIEIGGRDVTGLAPNLREIGMVFQRYALFPHMSVAENVGFALKMRRVPRRERAGKVDEILALVRLAGYGGRRIGQLSGGQQQRVALARALVHRPPLLLMDEPLGALDKNLREEMQLEIKRIQQQLGTTVIFVTHDQSEALSMADRIAVVNEGRILQYGPARDIYHRPADAFVAGFVGETNFIGGTVHANGGNALFRSDDGAIAFSLGREHGQHGWRDGMPACAAIRPEALGAGKGQVAVSGTVENTTFGGDRLRCQIACASGLMLVASLPGSVETGVHRGDRIDLAFSPEQARVFPA